MKLIPSDNVCPVRTSLTILLAFSILITGCQSGDSRRSGQPAELPAVVVDDPSEDCPIDIDIHLPAAQDAGTPLVAENLDETRGAWTLRNGDMDTTTDDINRTRLQNGTDLKKSEGTPDSEVQGSVPAENDLVRIDLRNPNGLKHVYMNVYAMAAESGRGRVDTHKANQPANRVTDRLRIWRNANRTGPVTLPLAIPGPQDRIWVEGLAGGRYRFVLLYLPDGTPEQAGRVRATEPGYPHGQTTPGGVTLNPPEGVVVECHDNVRLTVVIADIFQQNRREHLYDVLWGGRPVFDGRVWPGGGRWNWSQNAGFAGIWLKERVHRVTVSPDGSAQGGYARIRELHGSFEPAVQAVGQGVSGSGLYERRVILRYQVEGVTFEREEPVTLMVPDHITFTPMQPLDQAVGSDHWGSTYRFTLQAQYRLFDQHDRHLVGPRLRDYRRQYGAQLQAYEALGMGRNASESNDNVTWTYTSPVNPARTFSVPIGTKQRRRAVPGNNTLSNGQFTDSFELRINNNQRGMLQQDIRQNPGLASNPVFEVSQDVVTLLNNGAAEYDVRVARGQSLRILAPEAQPAPAAPWGGMGFRITLGGAGGTTPDTGNPDRVASDHNPPAP